jgi:nucleoside-diphosphate-sugar epimerase
MAQREAETGSEGGGGGASIVSGKVLIRGGAGFLGSHVADELPAAGCEARVLDSLPAQVHGRRDRPPTELAPWRTGQSAIDRADRATLKLERRGLTL